VLELHGDRTEPKEVGAHDSVASPTWIQGRVMIWFGADNQKKNKVVVDYCREKSIQKVVVIGPDKFLFECTFHNHEHVDWPEVQMYRTYYRLLQETDSKTLLVVNEGLRSQNRYDLNYSCIRNYLNQTPHVIVFQYLPMIDTWDDFSVLFDFTTQSRWKRDKITSEHLDRIEIRGQVPNLTLKPVCIETTTRLKTAYQKKKRSLIDGIGLKDPHTIPRQLYLMSGKAKSAHVNNNKQYVGRNNRFKFSNLTTYRSPVFDSRPYIVFEYCHRFIDFSDFLSLSRQEEVVVLTTDLKIDQWYMSRFQDWVGRIQDAAATLRQ
jgi:hypothetical protein